MSVELREDFIQVTDLKKDFSGTEVLKGISTQIRKGEVVVILGPSGSGKSTFLRCLNLLEVPSSGQIFFEGTEITNPKNGNGFSTIQSVSAYDCIEKPHISTYKATQKKQG